MPDYRSYFSRHVDAAYLDRFAKVEAEFDRDALKRICEMHEDDFGGLERFVKVDLVKRRPTEDFYYFQDNGASILAVAHLDTVGDHKDRTANFVQTADGEVVFSRALDDRLGAYIILDLLPRLGVHADILLTVGEETGNSTASAFEAPEGRQYDWIIEFDRGGTDVVMYAYEDDDLIERVEASGARVGDGIFSDIGELEHLEAKGINWGVGYQDYHGPRAHAFLQDTFMMVAHFMKFHEQNAGEWLPHDNTSLPWRGWASWRAFDDHLDALDERADAPTLWAEDKDPDFVGPQPERFDDEGYYLGGVISAPTQAQLNEAIERL